MSEIKLLDNGMINKIAAGEVVERPASVVKELVENAVDAGSTAVTVEIKDGGISFIRVTDNGCGIAKEQVKSAFLRHATSKIYNMDDLENVLTLGFRGEALSSIAAVSEVELITKTSGSEAGMRIEISGGEVVSQGEAGSADGTTFIMRNLFFNVPARRKFLKKAATESGYVSDIVTKTALGHPEIAFKYINNNSTLIQTNGSGDLAAAVFSIYGKDAVQKMLPVKHGKNGFVLTGVIGKNELSRANRAYESFYINGRYVKSPLVEAAVIEAYQTRLPIGRFPVFVLNLQSAPSFVDVNVHPTKLEVRFGDEELVYNFVREAVENAFKGQDLIPKQEIVKGGIISDSGNYVGAVLNEADTAYTVEAPPKDLPPITYIQMSELGYKEVAESGMKGNGKIETGTPREEPVNTFFKNYKIAGHIFDTYWLIEQADSLYIIDQHAAHERVLFEEVTERLKSGNIASQKLAVPIAVNLSQSEKQVVIDNIELLESFGFEIEELGEQAYAVRAVPYIFNNPAETGFFLDIVDKLAGVDTSVQNIYDTKINGIATISCKAAVKANDRLSYIEAKALIDKIVKLENPFTCPHGRPTVVEITKYELEKMFKRV